MALDPGTPPPCDHSGNPRKLAGECVACGKPTVWLKPRRLCRRCYDTPAVRNAHPINTKNVARAGLGTCDIEEILISPLPEPTEHEPGSEGKIVELARRASLGLQLFNPRDAKKNIR